MSHRPESDTTQSPSSQVLALSEPPSPPAVHKLPTSPPQPSSEFQGLVLPQNRNKGNSSGHPTLQHLQTSRLREEFTDDSYDDDQQGSFSKRKAAESPIAQRPKKHHRVMTAGKLSTNDDAAMADVDEYSDAGEPNGYDALDDVVTSPVQESQDWKKTLDRVVKSVVALRYCQPCSFDGESAMASQASGFVVDAERGYILTNRHVVGSGPFWGYCIFENHEEVDVYPLYRDPIHDFGILRFDPKAIKYMKVEELKIVPEGAKVGTEIRVVGNDAGEKLSILQGVISRLDRNAPEYGYGGFNDFNTCYYQANASASGGSSGSPVINKDGHAIALQAGGRGDASTDYFLPLDRPLRALKCIQAGQSVVRGDIQCQFLFKAFDECRRLGLPSHWETEIRAAFPDATNMLVAEIVLPDGPSHQKLEEGDVLLKINGELLMQFIRFDEILDSNVGGTVRVLVNRSGEDVEVEIKVGDLHIITPDRYVTALGGIFQDLSYQQARNFAIAIQGVFVAESGGSWRLEGDGNMLIQSVDKKKTPDLKTFIEVLKTIPDKARVVVTYKQVTDLHTLNTMIMHVDRHWTPKIRMAIRNDESGLWDYTNLSDPLPALPMVPRSATFIEVENAPSQEIADLVRSFVHVECYMPMKLDGFPKSRTWGMGLVVDADQGLVLISRAVVPFDLCDITVTVADSVQVEAKVVFLHPLQNYTIIRYNPGLVDAPVLTARLSEEPLTQGAAINFVGFNRPTRMVHMPTTVTEVMTTAIPANPISPRYRALNVDAIMIDSNLGTQCGSGALATADGSIRAVWLTYMGERNASTGNDDEHHLGLCTKSLLPVINQIRAGAVPKLRILSVEFRPVSIAKARVIGVPEEWIKRVTESNKTLHQLFTVNKRAFERGDIGGGLEEGDVILTFNDKIMSRASDLDIMYDQEVLRAVIVRDNEVLTIDARTVVADDVETDYALVFCGALLHRPHHAVRQEISKLHSEIYISARSRGSPAFQYGLGPTNFITHVNSKPTPDLAAFIAVVKDIPDNTYFRLRIVTFDSVPWVVTLKKNDHYFPMVEWLKDPAEECGWRRVTHESGQVVEGEADDGIEEATGGMETAKTEMEED